MGLAGQTTNMHAYHANVYCTLHILFFHLYYVDEQFSSMAMLQLRYQKDCHQILLGRGRSVGGAIITSLPTPGWGTRTTVVGSVTMNVNTSETIH